METRVCVCVCVGIGRNVCGEHTFGAKRKLQKDREVLPFLLDQTECDQAVRST